MKDVINYKDTTIKCPYCAYEYLPGEIYIPKYFVGQPKEVERLVDGKVDVEFGIPQDLTEHYVCDHCNRPFTVEATITYNVTKDADRDFSEDYTTSLFSDRIMLTEEDN